MTPSGATSSQAVQPMAYSTECSPESATIWEKRSTDIPGARRTTRVTGRETSSSKVTTRWSSMSSPSGKSRETLKPKPGSSTARIPSGTAAWRVSMAARGSKVRESTTS